MSKLTEARQEINAIDRQMAELFERRMRAVEQICAFKKENGLPIEDSSREQAVIEKNSAFIEDDVIREYYVNFIQNTMETSKRYQHRLMRGMRVAYCGVSGAFAQIASSLTFVRLMKRLLAVNVTARCCRLRIPMPAMSGR